MRLKILSYNIHKGFDFWGRFTLQDMHRALHETDADLLLLQEVVGENEKLLRHSNNRATEKQFEFLADTRWPHFSYGKNAIFPKRHHGNATLSKYPILSHHNLNLTMQKFEMRGLLHTQIQLIGQESTLHVLNTHLDLFETNRIKQVQKIVNWINTNIPKDEPFLLAGDFNDWPQRLSRLIEPVTGASEAFRQLHGRYAASFPNFFPRLCLDRLYVRNAEVLHANVLTHSPWTRLSDHLPLFAELEIR